jgi:sugar phosphate isomerase/epimerase
MFYSAHAGFCIDPKPDKLGGFIQVKKDFNRSEHIDIFIDSLNKILDVATSLKISFYVENNVISRKNYLGNGYTNPFLCCDSEEINNIFKKINHNNLGLLLDTGHLKVSSSTLGLNPEKEVNKVLNYVCAVHHSDNNGKVDSNEILDENYWFLKFKKYFSLWDHVIEVRNLSPKQIKEQINIIN